MTPTYGLRMVEPEHVSIYGNTFVAKVKTRAGYRDAGMLRVCMLTCGSEAFVSHVLVEPEYGRNGLATRLYLRAALFVQDRHEVKLGSGVSRTPNSEALWRSFVKAGLATPVVGNGADMIRQDAAGNFKFRPDRRWKHESYRMNELYGRLPERVEEGLTLPAAEKRSKVVRAEGFLGVRIEAHPENDTWRVQYFVPPMKENRK